MRNRIQIRGDIDSGWAKLDWKFQEQDLTLLTSYIFDGLYNLLAAISALNAGVKKTEASLIDEPEEHIVHFIINDEKMVVIKIYSFDDWSKQPLADRINLEPSFTAKAPLKQLTNQIINLFEDFKVKYGIEGYNSRWGHEFPQQTITNLINLTSRDL